MSTLFDSFFIKQSKKQRMIYTSLRSRDPVVKNNQSVFVVTYTTLPKDLQNNTFNFDELQRQIDYLKTQFDFVTLPDIESYLNGSSTISHPSIALTFDCGYKELLSTKEFFYNLSIRPTVFVVSDPAHANKSELSSIDGLLSVDELKELHEAGWFIGACGRRYNSLPSLSSYELKQEIIHAKVELERKLNLQIDYFSYPKGLYSDEAIRYVLNAGYRMAFTRERKYIQEDTNILTVPRIEIPSDCTFEKFKQLIHGEATITDKVMQVIKSTTI